MSDDFSLDTGINVHSTMQVNIPEELTLLMRSILACMDNQGHEVGIYLKGELDMENMIFNVSMDEYYLPRQRVSAATITFDEDPPKGFNVVVHRHPNGCNDFSGTDRGSINREFDCSILFLKPDSYPTAVVNLDLNEVTRFQVRANVSVVRKMFKIDDEFRQKVRSRVRPNQEYLSQGGAQQALPAPGKVNLRRRTPGGQFPQPELDHLNRDHERRHLAAVLGQDDGPFYDHFQEDQGDLFDHDEAFNA